MEGSFLLSPTHPNLFFVGLALNSFHGSLLYFKLVRAARKERAGRAGGAGGRGRDQSGPKVRV